MSRSPTERAFALTGPLYAAATHPPAWRDFLEALAEDLGGASIAMSLMLPGWNVPPEYYRVNLSEKYVPAFERHFRQGLPWPMTHALFRQGFAHGREIFPDEEVPGTGYYEEYMRPQGMAPEGPLAHLIVSADGRPVSGISIQRMEGGRPFTDADLETCNLLVPHLATATIVRQERIRADQEQVAQGQILDRMAVGIVIVDIAQRAVLTNRAAREMLDAGDGLYERDGVLHATGQRDDRELQRLIRSTIEMDPAGESASAPFEGGFLSISRPSGQPSYALTSSRVFDSFRKSALGDAVAAIFVTNPTPGQVPHSKTFQLLFGLTKAEAEVVGLLAAGHSLDEISRARGVKLATTRTLLKRVFAKTKTRRQGEIVRLVLAGVAPVGDDAPFEG